jgi:MFS transporter, PPP family, 3-phenylpropionic acid transporter
VGGQGARERSPAGGRHEAAGAAGRAAPRRGPGRLAAGPVGPAYLFVFAAGASLIPFLSLYYRSIGFDAGTIGWLLGLPLVVSVLAAPAWAALADATHRHRAVLAFTLGGAAAAAFLIGATGRLLLLVPIVLLHALLYAPVNSLIDNGALVALGERSIHYGRLRLWGSAGWGIAALAAGWLVSRQGPRSIFPLYAVLMLCTLACALHLPSAARRTADPFRRRLALLTADERLWAFLGLTLTGGVGMSMVNAYLPLDLQGLGATDLVGVALLVATLSELPVMLLGARILARLGYARAFVLAYAVYGVRALAMSLLQAPWFLVALQATHGLSFALMWIAGVGLARSLAPAGLGATAQGLFASTSIGLGGAIGSVVGGAVFAALGPAATFRSAAVLLGGAVPLLALAASRRRRSLFLL